MRVLLMHHGPLAGSPQGALVRGWARALAQAGHEARVLLADDHRPAPRDLATRVILCRPGDPTADLPFAIPCFAAEASPGAGVSFGSLGDEQLRSYRDQIRRHLDAEVDQFDPHVIHVQHVWVGAQLALETGVPYVVSAWEVELADYANDSRYRRWVDQAAENAARILACDERLRERAAGMFDVPLDRVTVMTPAMLACGGDESTEARAMAAAQLAEIYQHVLDERFGKRD